MRKNTYTFKSHEVLALASKLEGTTTATREVGVYIPNISYWRKTDTGGTVRVDETDIEITKEGYKAFKAHMTATWWSRLISKFV
jgi:hypothetical protein